MFCKVEVEVELETGAETIEGKNLRIWRKWSNPCLPESQKVVNTDFVLPEVKKELKSNQIL